MDEQCPAHGWECRDAFCRVRDERGFKGPFAPYWPDGCGHSSEDFLGTVMEDGRPVDCYVFPQEQRSFGSCARFGPRPEDYRSGEYRIRDRADWDRAGDYLIASAVDRLGVNG